MVWRRSINIIILMVAIMQSLVTMVDSLRYFSKLKYVHQYQVLPRTKPLMSVDDTILEGISEAFVGGTVGVMSVMMMLELKKKEDLSLESCPYCMGNGEILCAACCGCGSQASHPCQTCGGIGLVTCINCKGDGRITPILLQSRAVRDPEFASDGIGIDSP